MARSIDFDLMLLRLDGLGEEDDEVGDEHLKVFLVDLEFFVGLEEELADEAEEGNGDE